MFIQTEQTPNPQTLKFLPGKVVMDEGTAFYQDIKKTSNSPLAKEYLMLKVLQVFFLEVTLLQLQKITLLIGK